MGGYSVSWKAWLLPVVPLLLWLLSRQFLADTDLFYSINRYASQWSDGTWAFFVYLGNGWGIFSLAFPLILLAPRALMAAAAAGLSAGLFSRVLKISLDVPRPAAVLDRSSFRIVGDALEALSMPSGHTLTVFAIATALYFSLPSQHRFAGIWLFGLAVLGGIGRVAVGAHWPADVYAGASIGLFFGIAAVVLFNRMPDHWFTPQSWMMRFAAAMGMFCLYVLATSQIDLSINRPLQTAGMVIVTGTLFHFLPASFGRKR